MEEDQFLKLTSETQVEFTWQQGQILASRSVEPYIVNLYYVHKYYVEIWLDLESNTVYKTVCTSSSNILHPYLEAINIGSGLSADKESYL